MDEDGGKLRSGVCYYIIVSVKDLAVFMVTINQAGGHLIRGRFVRQWSPQVNNKSEQMLILWLIKNRMNVSSRALNHVFVTTGQQAHSGLCAVSLRSESLQPTWKEIQLVSSKRKSQSHRHTGENGSRWWWRFGVGWALQWQGLMKLIGVWTAPLISSLYLLCTNRQISKIATLSMWRVAKKRGLWQMVTSCNVCFTFARHGLCL